MGGICPKNSEPIQNHTKKKGSLSSQNKIIDLNKPLIHDSNQYPTKDTLMVFENDGLKDMSRMVESQATQVHMDKTLASEENFFPDGIRKCKPSKKDFKIF